MCGWQASIEGRLCKARIAQFLIIQRSMIVPGHGQWGGKQLARCEDGLVHVLEVGTTHQFADHQGGKIPGSVTLVYAQKVDLGTSKRVVI